jgi:hypothetical protein
VATRGRRQANAAPSRKSPTAVTCKARARGATRSGGGRGPGGSVAPGVLPAAEWWPKTRKAALL